MKWIKNLRGFPKHVKLGGDISKLCSSSTNKYENGNPNAKKIVNHILLQTQGGCLSPKLLQQASSGTGAIYLSERLSLVKDEFRRFGMYSFCKGNPLGINQIPLTISHRFGHTQNDPDISRDWLVKLWDVDERLRSSKRKRRRRVVQHGGSTSNLSENLPSFQRSLGRWFSGASVTEEKPYEQVKPVLKQPPLSQSTTGFLEPTSPEEVKFAPLLARSNLLITRNIEWANLVFGFEQENRYAIVDACYPQMPVGFIHEQSNFISRQLLRLRRPFVAYITDATGNEIFRIRRPFWWITSTIFAEIDGKEIGVVHRRWHLWRRVYDLYLGNKQFAVVENPGFWNWTFTLKDIDGNVLAEINRDWRGFGFELFTDAGQYVIRFGDVDPRSKIGPARAIKDLEITRPLTLSERAVVVALAVSLDNDYFSRHGGWGIPFMAVEE